MRFELIFWLSITILGYTNFGYYLLLNILARLFTKKNEVETQNGNYPKVTIIVAAYNEGKVIEQRINNLLELAYPKDKIEIIIASDGSSDRTVEIAKQYEKQRVVVLDFKENRGRADVHNDSVKIANGEVVVFTDADTTFEKDFVNKIVSPFYNPRVGCVVGQLIYKSEGTNISEAESLYYNKWERNSKKFESALGILTNGTGACMAIRKDLFKLLTPVDDIDTATVIDIALQGYRVIYAKDATAYDLPPSSVKSELRYRIRGTSKTIMSISRRTDLKGWLKNPFLSWSLLSHRIFRYLTPYFMAVALISNLFLLRKGTFYQASFFLQIAFYLLVIVGWIGEYTKKKIPVISNIFIFSVVMLGIMIGVATAIIGRAPSAYKMDD